MSLIVNEALAQLNEWISVVEEIGINTREMHTDMQQLTQLAGSPKEIIHELKETKYKWNQIMQRADMEDASLTTLIEEIQSKVFADQKAADRKENPQGYSNPSSIFAGQIAAAACALPHSRLDRRESLAASRAATPPGILGNAIFDYSPVQTGYRFFEQPLESQIKSIETLLEVLHESFGKSKDPILRSIQIQHAQNYLSALRQLKLQRDKKPKDVYSLFMQCSSEAPTALEERTPEKHFPFPVANRPFSAQHSSRGFIDTDMSEPPPLSLDVPFTPGPGKEPTSP